MDRTQISRIFTLLAHEHRVPGAQLVIAHGDDAMTFEYGPLDRDAKVPVGSVTKAFTAGLAMVLVSDGDLELDNPVADYLPELRGASDDDFPPVTLRHLLSHTAGLPSGTESTTRSTSVRRRVLDGWRGLTPLAPPGLGFSYSNFGYVVVGHLIEVVTGMTWWEAMEAVLLKPLGITPVFVVSPTATPSQPIVTGHSVHRMRDRVRPVEQSLPLVDAPAGALATSAFDLATFGRMLAGADSAIDLIDPALLAEMRQPAPGAQPFGLADGWGLGLALFRTANGCWSGHDGTADGTACHFRIAPDGTVIALTTNANTGFAMWAELSAQLCTPGLAAGRRHDTFAAKRRVLPQEGCTGSYVNGDVQYTVVARDGHLQLIVDGEPFAALVLYENLEFEVREADDEHPQAGRFLRNPRTGRIDMMQLSGRLARRGEPDRAEDVA